MVLKSIDYRPAADGCKATLQILDQLLLPHNMVYIPIKSTRDAHAAIKEMKVRGAPAIALVAVLSLIIDLQGLKGLDAEVAQYITSQLDYLVTSRPTAVNLSDAANKLKHRIANAKADVGIRDIYRVAAEKMLADDVLDNVSIGRHGANHIMSDAQESRISVLTICNTGSLATAGHGTAYSIINQLHQAGVLEKAYFCETRPYNQGARLTSAELLYDKIPSTMILDSSVAALLSGAKKGQDPSKIKAIVVGADRVARNGDTANKIGTCQLAILAAHFGVQFYVCAPWTTIDVTTESGEDIIVEERAQKEVRQVWGATYDENGILKKDKDGLVERGYVEVCSEDVDVWNPAFDVTPHELITGIVTEHGVLTRDSSGSFQLEQKRATFFQVQ